MLQTPCALPSFGGCPQQLRQLRYVDSNAPRFIEHYPAHILETSKQDTRKKQQEGHQHRLKTVSAHHRNSSISVSHEESQDCEQHRKDERYLGWRRKVHAVFPLFSSIS
jgi:hypothetical protein